MAQGFNNYLQPGSTNVPYNAYSPLTRRTPQETALAALQQYQAGPGGLRNIAPGLVGQQRDRAQQAASTYQLQAALGGYGAPAFGANDFQLGAYGNVQQIIQDAVNAALGAGNYSGVQAPRSFRAMIQDAQGLFGNQDPTSGQYADVAEALGFTNAEDTQGAYGGFINRFLAPRIDQARGPMRNMLARQLDERSRNYFENPNTQMVQGNGPSDFLQYITRGF